MSELNDGRIQLRLPNQDLTAFIRRCNAMNRNHQDVLREIVVAFHEERLVISPNPELRKLYDDRKDS